MVARGKFHVSTSQSYAVLSSLWPLVVNSETLQFVSLWPKVSIVCQLRFSKARSARELSLKRVTRVLLGLWKRLWHQNLKSCLWLARAQLPNTLTTHYLLSSFVQGSATPSCVNSKSRASNLKQQGQMAMLIISMWKVIIFRIVKINRIRHYSL